MKNLKTTVLFIDVEKDDIKAVKQIQTELTAAIRSTTEIINHEYSDTDADACQLAHPDAKIRFYYVTPDSLQVEAFRNDMTQANKSNVTVYLLNGGPKSTIGDLSDLEGSSCKVVNANSFRARYLMYSDVYQYLYGLPVIGDTAEAADYYWGGLYRQVRFEKLEDIMVGAGYVCTAASQNNMYALCYVGACFLYGMLPFELDEEAAIRLVSAAADLGNPVAASIIGKCYYTGRGGCQDYGLAMYWLLAAVNSGLDDDEQTFTLLSEIYAEGLGGIKDEQRATFYANKAEIAKQTSKEKFPQNEQWRIIAYNTELLR